MKLLIASDLHGSSFYVEKLLARVSEEKPDKLVLLGDILYHGPRNALPRDYDTKKTASLLNALEEPPLCIQGNCDGEVDQMMLTFPMLAKFGWLYADGQAFYLTHGHHLQEAAAAVPKGGIVLFGHTHVPAFYEEENRVFVNPGSVSIPKKDSHHSYLVYKDKTFYWKKVNTGEVIKTEYI